MLEIGVITYKELLSAEDDERLSRSISAKYVAINVLP
jgi:hypothetical protein